MLFSTGALAGQLSGRLGSIVASKNRYGSYFRAGTTPVTSTTEAALAAKARMTAASQAWQGLTAAQQLDWFNWASQNPTVNRIGQSITLTGQAAFVGIYTRLSRAGDTPITVPPLSPAPLPLTSLSITADIGIGGFTIDFAATPVSADDRLWTRCAVLTSAGVKYVENQLRLVDVSAKNQATAYDAQTVIEARLGALQVGEIVVIECAVFSSTTGLLSAALRAQDTVVDTA